ncbi:hypothetical protein DFH06DRAFT_1293858 [Mycena polygramma]|nr:hypothetical protein DFH06DRAFT_1293858 [Mycena polygramma]
MQWYQRQGGAPICTGTHARGSSPRSASNFHCGTRKNDSPTEGPTDTAGLVCNFQIPQQPLRTSPRDRLQKEMLSIRSPLSNSPGCSLFGVPCRDPDYGGMALKKFDWWTKNRPDEALSTDGRRFGKGKGRKEEAEENEHGGSAARGTGLLDEKVTERGENVEDYPARVTSVRRSTGLVGAHPSRRGGPSRESHARGLTPGVGGAGLIRSFMRKNGRGGQTSVVQRRVAKVWCQWWWKETRRADADA